MAFLAFPPGGTPVRDALKVLRELGLKGYTRHKNTRHLWLYSRYYFLFADYDVDGIVPSRQITAEVRDYLTKPRKGRLRSDTWFVIHSSGLRKPKEIPNLSPKK